MTLAADTREAVRRAPYLFEALRAGVVNYAAAARELGVSDDTGAVAAALRRMTNQLPPLEPSPANTRVTMHSGVTREDTGSFLSVGDTGYALGDGPLTGIVATGAVDAVVLDHVVGVCRINDIEILGAGFADDAIVVIVERRDGPDTLRFVESALEAVPR